MSDAPKCQPEVHDDYHERLVRFHRGGILVRIAAALAFVSIPADWLNPLAGLLMVVAAIVLALLGYRDMKMSNWGMRG